MLAQPDSYETLLARRARPLDGPVAWLHAVRAELAKVIVGQQDLIDTLILGLLCHGHILVEGNPGLAKTLTAKTLGAILDLEFKRLQATPDVTPGDILGTDETRGPIFTQILPVDEINRAQPKTQSALLEAMEERQVSVKGRGVQLPTPFVVLATQNPIEQEGTNPLPEAQLDRFMFKVRVGYPDEADLCAIVQRQTQAPRVTAEPIGQHRHLTVLQRDVRERTLPEDLLRYIARLVLATHPESPHAPPLARRYVLYGVSPRGALSLAMGSQAPALLDGREAPTVGDVRAVAVRALQHRIILNFEGAASGIAPGDIVEDVLNGTKVSSGAD